MLEVSGRWARRQSRLLRRFCSLVVPLCVTWLPAALEGRRMRRETLGGEKLFLVLSFLRSNRKHGDQINGP